MPDNTPGAPADDRYVEVIGRALYNFAYIEWEVLYLGSLLVPGFVNRDAGNDSRTIAREFSLLAEVGRERFPGLKDIADRFAIAEQSRVELLRATPFTGPLGAQILHSEGTAAPKQWDMEAVSKYLTDLESLATDADVLFYKLKST